MSVWVCGQGRVPSARPWERDALWGGWSSFRALTAGLASQLLAEAYIPPQVFYNGKVDYFDLQRLGGLLSHLRKTLKGAFQPVGSERVRAWWAAVPEPALP